MAPKPYNVVLDDETYKGEIKIGLKFIPNVRYLYFKGVELMHINYVYLLKFYFILGQSIKDNLISIFVSRETFVYIN